MQNQQLGKNRWKRILESEFAIILVLFVMCAIIAAVTPMFASPRNVVNVLRRTASTGIVAVGMTFIIGTGGIDLSVGGQVTMMGVLAAMGMNAGLPAWLMVALMFAMGLCFGLFNGLGVTILKLPPIMVTLALQLIAYGMSLYWTNGRTFSITVDGFDYVGLGTFLSVPVPIWIFVVFIIAGLLILHRFSIGRKILAVGSNAKGAWYAGINVVKTTIVGYVITGITCAMSSWILSSKLLSASATTGQGMEMDCIAAIVIGGTSLSGGSASIIGTVAGALMIEVIGNWMTLQNVNSYLRDVVKGVIILVALIIDNVRRNKLNRNEFEG